MRCRHPIASMVTTDPLIIKNSRSAGIAAISLLCSSTFCWPSTKPWVLHLGTDYVYIMFIIVGFASPQGLAIDVNQPPFAYISYGGDPVGETLFKRNRVHKAKKSLKSTVGGGGGG